MHFACQIAALPPTTARSHASHVCTQGLSADADVAAILGDGSGEEAMQAELEILQEEPQVG